MNRMLRSVTMVAAVSALVVFANADTIVIKGSNTFGEELGPKLIDAYKKKHPHATFELEHEGSGTGLEALLESACDIASSSRPINEDEVRLARSRGLDLAHYTVGYYGVAVIVNDKNPLSNLSDAEVRDIFTGAIDNWKDVGGDDERINLYIHDEQSGTRIGFQELAMERGAYSKSAKGMSHYLAIAGSVAKDPAGIGYVGMHAADEKGISALRINGMPPSSLSVNEGFYPYARLVRFYTDKNRENAEVKAFIHFVQSDDGQEVLESIGFVPRITRSRGTSPTLSW